MEFNLSTHSTKKVHQEWAVIVAPQIIENCIRKVLRMLYGMQSSSFSHIALSHE